MSHPIHLILSPGSRIVTRNDAKQFEAKLISADEAALWKRGASNAGYHYLGCAKVFALMGQSFAEGLLTMMKEQPGR